MTAQATILHNDFENYIFKIFATFLTGQCVNLAGYTNTLTTVQVSII